MRLARNQGKGALLLIQNISEKKARILIKYQIAPSRQVLLIVNPHLSLAKNRNFITLLYVRGYSSVVEHSTAYQEVTGSIPVAPFSFVSLFFPACVPD